jgi:hypothetical protein
MPFVYPDRPHTRRHGPAGYADYKSFKPWLRDEFQFRCVYCLERERWYPSRDAAFGVEHVRPQSDPHYAALICVYDNLVYACNRCNSVKRDEVLLDPCATAFADHVAAGSDGSISGLTPDGCDLVNLLGLNELDPMRVRQRYLRILTLYQTYPDDSEVRSLFLDHFGYPDDLPDLASLRPNENSRPAGVAESYFQQRAEGRLPETY